MDKIPRSATLALLATLLVAVALLGLGALHCTGSPAVSSVMAAPACADAAVRVRDPETGRLAAPGTSGELELRGDSLLSAYFGDAAATRNALTPDGFVRTGDLGRVEADGSVDAGEECDDGDAEGGDGCSAACVVEHGFACPGVPSVWPSPCGDGVVASDEECDDSGDA